MEIYSLDSGEVEDFLDDLSSYDGHVEDYHRDAFEALQEEAEETATLEVTGPVDYRLKVQRSEGEAVIEGELPPGYELDFGLEDVKNEVSIQ
jgi:hypothetical protein